MSFRESERSSPNRSENSKAAPRFELGIKDLQSSALPLGHAAAGERSFSPADRISEGTEGLLVISNGHGEDLIALRILEAVHAQSPRLRLSVLPLVGEGKAFTLPVQQGCLLYTSPSPRDKRQSRMPSSA